jgi:hypothetical protein
MKMKWFDSAAVTGCLFMSALVGADGGSDDEATAAAIAAAKAVMEAPMLDFQRCVTDILVSETAISLMREEIDTQCQEQRQQVFHVLPEDYQEYVLLNMDRRLDVVLEAMQDASGAVEESVDDAATIAGSLDDSSDGDGE